MKIRYWILYLLAALISAGGCANRPGKLADLRPAPVPQLSWKRQISSTPAPSAATSADMILREHRFVADSAELNFDGENQLERVAVSLKDSQQYITIESSQSAPMFDVTPLSHDQETTELDAERRKFVVEKLLGLGVADAEARVVLGNP